LEEAINLSVCLSELRYPSTDEQASALYQKMFAALSRLM
jgi:hypothetical protein